MNEKSFNIGYSKLNTVQKSILNECILKENGGLSLPMGSGKTIISLVLSLMQSIILSKKHKHENFPILIIASKSLISGWELEIKKFFGTDLKYEVLHQNTVKAGFNNWQLSSETQIVLMTPDTLSKAYKECRISEIYINKTFIHNAINEHLGNYINFYKETNQPFVNYVRGGGLLYSIKWGCYVVDEVQKYTNFNTIKSQAISAISSYHRWVLSGTMFDEPKPERIFGYYLILNRNDITRNFPEAQKFLKSDQFKGVNETLVFRTNNAEFIPPKVNDLVISHEMTDKEQLIYKSFKQILIEVKNKAKSALLLNNIEDARKFSSYKLVMIMYLRQAIICPIIPITSISLDASDSKNKSELSTIILDSLKILNLTEWLNDETLKSSRIQAVNNILKKHKHEKVIVFSCFKTFLDLLEYYYQKEIKNYGSSSSNVSNINLNTQNTIFRLTSKMSIDQRGKLIDDFKNSNSGILLITYDLGAEGLNLQFAATILLVDFWWNAAKTQQAIARIFRFGQIAKEINVYFFTSNTGIEKILFEKQKVKLQMLEELKNGKMSHKIPTIRMDEVIKLIEISDNEKLLNEIKYY
jgi:SNF2 family DNA or RNA helicase